MPQVTIHIDYDRCVNFAMQQNDVRVVKRIRVVNDGPLIENAIVRARIESELSPPWSTRIDRLEPASAYILDDVDLPLHAETLARQTERETTELVVEVAVDEAEQPLGTQRVSIDVLPYNAWGGLGSLPEMLAAFVLPNHPAIQSILAAARTHLEAATGSGSIDGYQSRDPARARAIVAAIYHAVCDAGIGYVNPPASFEDQGQKVRLPDQVFEHRLATCVDLALLMAAAFEQAGLHPLIVLVRGHAFVGAWLVNEAFPEASTEDAVRLRRRIALDEMIVLETTSATASPPKPFADAEREALRVLDDDDDFRAAIDIRASRKLRIRPLPTRITGEAVEIVASETPEVEETTAPFVPVAIDEVGGDDDVEPGDGERVTRLDRWKRRLLDLSLRNRLINHRQTKKSIPLLAPDLEALEDALARGVTFSIDDKPTIDETRQGEADALENFLLDEMADRRLRADLSATELERRLVETYRAARLAVEESGANQLFLALGFLNWYETKSSETVRRAPLLLLPAVLERKSARSGYRLRLDDDDARLNVTLLEKLRQEFGVDVRAELPEGEHGVDVQAIFRNFREAIRPLDRWEVTEHAELGLFSFTKFLMWLDLQERTEDLLRNDVVRHLVERPETPFADNDDEPWPDPAALREDTDPATMRCPMDADSSQLAAIVAAERGRSFMLEGPPGTGKSQTITNLIAQCLGQGKRVLFVSEKMAALDVVQKRLGRIGLAPFCLELHSNRANKKAVLSQMETSLGIERRTLASGWDRLADRLREARDDLDVFASAVHEPRPIGRSVHRVTSDLIGRRAIPRVGIDMPDDLDEAMLDELHDLVERLAEAVATVGDPATHALRAVGLRDWRTTIDDDVRTKGDACIDAAAGLTGATRAAFDALEIDASEPNEMARTGLEWITSLATLLPGRALPTVAILTHPGWGELKAALGSVIERGRRRDELKHRIASRWRDTLLDGEVEELRRRLDTAVNGGTPFAWFSRFLTRRKIKKHLAKGSLPDNTELLDDLQAAINLVRLDEELKGDERASELFGHAWKRSQADWTQLEDILGWTTTFRQLLAQIEVTGAPNDSATRERLVALATVERDRAQGEGTIATRLKAVVDALDTLDATRTSIGELLELDAVLAWGADDEAAYLARLTDTVGGWIDARRRLDEWCWWRRERAAAIDAGLAPILESVERGDCPPERLTDAFHRSVDERWLDRVTDAEDILRNFSAREHASRVRRFRELDVAHIDASNDAIIADLSQRVPQVRGEPSDASEVGILLRQLRLRRRHMPVRTLISSLPNLLPRLKPCFLMSPLSVAQYLDPSHPPFDLVVFDEASQIPVWDAVGAIARGTSVVVVGDSKQLPPTNFFMTMETEDEPTDDEFEEVESILDECGASGLHAMRLLWHYRSRHEGLIAFSNHHYYEGRLHTFPSPVDDPAELGVSFRYIEDAVYDRGGERSNRAEAEALVAEIVERLSVPGEPAEQYSIGVVTFSQAQQVLVEDLLDEARRKNPQLEPFFTDAVPEPVFVKNLENVQGDERDIILFSVGYGPDQHGRVSMSFGPLNREGGERRLNVAVTRSRRRVIVFSSIKGEHIDLARTRSIGVAHLKAFLEYAERGPRALPVAERLAEDAAKSPFLEAIRTALADRGWDVELRAGCSAFRVDVAVRDPDATDRYVLGILCDGPFYASATTARDRDRIRESVLGHLGWTLHRVWSTDWWRDPGREIERIERALRRDETPGEDEPDVDDEPAALEEDDPLEDLFDEDAGSRGGREPDVPGMATYRRFNARRRRGDTNDFYGTRATSMIKRAILKVIEREAPIRLELLGKRVAELWDFARVTGRAHARVAEVLDAIDGPETPLRDGEFLWAHDQDPQAYQTFRVPDDDDEDTERRAAEDIHPVEVANAARSVLETQIALPMEDLLRETAELFGFSRVSKNTRPAMEAGVEILVGSGGCVVDGEQVALPS